MNHETYLIGKKPFRGIPLGLSIAASWAWGVSIVVGMQVIQQRGLGAFLIWGSTNALALLLFGFVAKRSGDKLPTDVLSQEVRPIYKVLMVAIQFFSLLVNLTAIKLAMSMLGVTRAWIPFMLLTYIIVFLKGFTGNVKGDIAQIVAWISLMVVALVLQRPILAGAVQSGSGQIQWALWGAAILFSGPIVDQQMWQRKASMRDKLNIKPYVIATVVFAFYMVLVGLFGICNLNMPVVTAVVILCVAGSTLLSALSALSTYGKTMMRSKAIMSIFLLLAILAMLLNASVLSIWTLYGSIRIPFAIYLVYRVIKGAGHGQR